MKNYLKYMAFTLVGIATLSTFQSCKLKNPTEGLAIYMKPDAVAAPNSFAFIDAKTGYSLSELEGFEVKITGPGTSGLFTTDGLRTFKIINGQIGICVRRGLNPTPENPIEFDIVFDKVGFLKKTTHVEITSLLPVDQKITVLNLANLPATASKKDTSFTITGSGLPAPVKISTPATDSMPAVTIDLPTGTNFVDENGNAYSGELTVNLITSQTSGSDLGASPVGIDIPNLEDENGNPVTNSAFIPFNTYNLSISGNGKALKVLSPSKSLPINPYNFYPNRVIIQQGTRGLVTIGPDSNNIPTSGSITLSGAKVNYKTASIKINNPQYISQYSYRLVIRGMSPLGGFYASSTSLTFNSNSLTAQIFDNSIPAFIFTSQLIITGPDKTTTTFSLVEGENAITLPEPPAGSYSYISKFSVKCTNDGSFAILPEGWKIYLIKREDYFNTIVNGHRIQPADDQNSQYYIEVNAGKPISEKDANNIETVYNYVSIPLNALESNTEYIVCTYFGSKGLVFNDFDNKQSADGKLITPDGLQNATQDIVGGVKSMSVKCD